MESDSYKTIERAAEAVFRDKGSRFIAYAWPVGSEAEIKEHLDTLRKKHYDATHHCYAWRLGPAGEQFRVNDDGEPSGTAGKPIMGQMLSKELTDLLIVVVRYFGGTKLGVPGLINAYRESAAAVVENCTVVERWVKAYYRVRFSYPVMNGVMKVVKDMEPDVVSQEFDNICVMTLAIRRSRTQELEDRLRKCEGTEFESEGCR